jgi:hypothetical protein
MTEDELNAEAARRYRSLMAAVPEALKRVSNGNLYEQKRDGEFVTQSEWLKFVQPTLTSILVRHRDDWKDVVAANSPQVVE